MGNIVPKFYLFIPHSFSITNDLVQPHLEGLTLEEALAKKKLFIVDHNATDGIYTRDGFYVSFCILQK